MAAASRGRVAVALAVVALATALVVVRAATDDGSRVDRARERALAARQAGTAVKAGEALAAAGDLLQQEAAACDRRGDATACSAWRSAAAYAHVAAVEVLRCTEPGRVQASESLARHIDAVEVAAGRSIPEPPPLPECGFGRRGGLNGSSPRR